MSKTVYIIAGPNGAGKTTFALQYLKDITGCDNFINADMIAEGLKPLNPPEALYEAGVICLQHITRHIEHQEDFAFETTLSGRTYANLLKRLRCDQWRIVLFFLWIPGPEYSLKRVRERVRQGGHDIPEQTIYRRYPRLLKNFKELYRPLCDEIYCYDNSGAVPEIIFYQNKDETKIIDPIIYDTIMRCNNDK